MIRAALEKLEEMAHAGKQVGVIKVGEVEYVTGDVTDVRKKDPEPDTLGLHTLTAVVDYIRENRDDLEREKCVLHIVDPTTVELRGPITGHFRQRTRFIRAQATDLTQAADLRMGRFHPVEDVVIGLQALFVASPERAELIRVLGNVKGETVTTQVDDGMTQEVSVRAGALVDKLQVPNPVTLAPYRTFREVEQPAAPFLVRVKKSDQNGILVGLFEADGGAWRLEAVKRIRTWLEEAGVSPVVILG